MSSKVEMFLIEVFENYFNNNSKKVNHSEKRVRVIASSVTQHHHGEVYGSSGLLSFGFKLRQGQLPDPLVQSLPELTCSLLTALTIIGSLFSSFEITRCFCALAAIAVNDTTKQTASKMAIILLILFSIIYTPNFHYFSICC